MSVVDKNYHNLLSKIMEEGYTYEDPNRKGVKRLEIPSYTFRHEFKNGFPAISTKKLHYKNVVTELIWFLRGDTNIKYLVDNGCNIWNKDAYNYYLKLHKQYKFGSANPFSLESFINFIKTNSKRNLRVNLRYGNYYYFGDLGPVYGHQWRNFNGIDQIQRLITNLKEKPLATDHIVNSWNVGDLQDMALPPCHYGFQIVVRSLSTFERVKIYQPNTTNENILSDAESTISQYLDENSIPKYGFELHWTQRSTDLFLGAPYNIASYATLALILEKIIGYKALAIQGDLKKVHLYNNSLDAVKEQLSRDVDKYDKCELTFPEDIEFPDGLEYNLVEGLFKNNLTLDDFFNEMKPDWFKLENYESYPHIKCEMLERDK